MKTSEQTNELFAALAKAQAAFDPIQRTRTVKVQTKSGGSYEFSYAPLDEVLRATRQALAANGLSVSHPCEIKEGVTLCCGTRISHASGQWAESCLEVNRPSALQEVGSALTYMRRYTLTGLLGVVADEDDDGNAASGNHAEFADREPSPNCPACANNKAVIAGKEEYGGGWLCWKNKGGCGVAWHDGRRPAPEKGKPKASGKKITKADDEAAAKENPAEAASKTPALIAKIQGAQTFDAMSKALVAALKENLAEADDYKVRQSALIWLKAFHIDTAQKLAVINEKLCDKFPQDDLAKQFADIMATAEGKLHLAEAA